MPRKNRKMKCGGLLVREEAGRKGAEIVALVSGSLNEHWNMKEASREIHQRMREVGASSDPETAVEACACALIMIRKMLSQKKPRSRKKQAA